jgi:hypothetical protein
MIFYSGYIPCVPGIVAFIIKDIEPIIIFSSFALSKPL